MKTYLEIQVPLRYDAAWFDELRCGCQHTGIKWQTGFYHITMVFVDKTPTDVDLRPLLEKYLNRYSAPTLTFDKLDAFTATSGMHIINLTATEVPQSFLAVVQAIRSDFKSAGCVINSEFRLHVTLGRVKDPHVQLPGLQKMLEAISLPAFSLTLTDVDYRVFRSGTIYETKLCLD